MVKEGVELVRLFNGRRQAQPVEHQGPGSQYLLLAFAVPVQPELEKVGENQIRKGGAVALELLGMLDPVQPLFRRFLGLNVADDAVLAVPEAEIRVSSLGGLGKRGDVYVRPAGCFGDPVQHFRKCRIETLLPGVASMGHGGQIFEVG